MFFRNLTLFRFSAASARQLADLEAALAEHPLRPCGALELFTRGFVSPLGGEEEAFTRTLEGRSLFVFGQEDKLLPAAVVAAETSRRAREQAQREGTPISGRQRRAIRTAVVEELLPRAFGKPSRTHAWVDREQGWLVVDTASRNRAETVLATLRDAVGGFPAMPLAPGEPPPALLTRWLAGDRLPAGLSLGDECELRDPGPRGGAVVGCRHQDLGSAEIRAHLEAGKQVARLGLTLDDRLSFVLGEDLVVRKLRLHEVVLEELAEAEGDAVAELDAHFLLVSAEVQRLLENLAQWFSLARPDHA